jgi:hypothetical protein
MAVSTISPSISRGVYLHGMGQRIAVTRVCVLGGGLAMGLASSTVVPGCILQDYCIVINTWGTDWCMYVEDAQMWPIGQPELAERVPAKQGGPPIGCLCFNDGEVQIFGDEVPAEQYDKLVAQLEENARNECAWAVPPGYDHSCYLEDGPLAPILSVPYSSEPNNDCIGSCGYIKPPPWGTCGADPNPWECNGEGSGETGTQETDSSGSDTGDIETGIDPGVMVEREVLR